MRKAMSVVALVAVGVLTACASSGGGGLSDPSQLRHDMGRATYTDLMNAVDKIMEAKYKFAFQRIEENYNTVWLESEWKIWELLEDEIAQGYQGARTLVIIDGRRGPNNTFRLRFTAHYEVRPEGSQTWEQAPVTPMREEEIRRVLSDMDMEIRAGVRTIG